MASYNVWNVVQRNILETQLHTTLLKGKIPRLKSWPHTTFETLYKATYYKHGFWNVWNVLRSNVLRTQVGRTFYESERNREIERKRVKESDREIFHSHTQTHTRNTGMFLLTYFVSQFHWYLNLFFCTKTHCWDELILSLNL